MERYDHHIRFLINNDTYADVEEVRSLLTRYTGNAVTNTQMIQIVMSLVKQLDREGKLKQYIYDLKMGERKVDWG
jgi:hypothetical protein